MCSRAKARHYDSRGVTFGAVKGVVIGCRDEHTDSTGALRGDVASKLQSVSLADDTPVAGRSRWSIAVTYWDRGASVTLAPVNCRRRVVSERHLFVYRLFLAKICP